MKEVLDYKEDFGENTSRLLDGSQTHAFLCESDIVIYVGNRGVGKTHLLLSKSLPHIAKPYYRSIYFRKQLKDSQTVGSIADKSIEMYGQFGRYLQSLQLLTWRFDSGARIVFGNYSASEKEFMEAIQGIEYYRAFIDEVTQISEDRFKAIYSNLRNTRNEKTQIFGSCNADPDSWIKNLIWWYIDPETGYHIPERNGVEIYFYQYGDTIKESFWGRTKEEVLKLAERKIDEMWDERMDKFGSKLDIIQSLTVFEGHISENIHLMKSGGVAYYGKLLAGSMDMKARYARACWAKRVDGVGLLSESDWNRAFDNSEKRSGVKYATLDVAGSGEGSDNFVLYIWDGFHVEAAYIENGLDAKTLKGWVARHLSRHGVRYENFAYDAIGVGYALSGHFEGSVEFMSQSSPSKKSLVKFDGKMLNVYRNARAEIAGMFVEKMTNDNQTGECGISFSETVLDININGRTLREQLIHESRALMWNEDREGIKQLLSRKDMISRIGHSPDFLFALLYRMALDRHRKEITNEKASELIKFLNL